ncbi:MAG: hypothetical protein JST55_16925 [Bacteroidetes bacterium]|nr:hypothetical protein [Bacteroidota bacterium]
MSKLISKILFLFAASLVIYSCSKSDDTIVNPVTPADTSTNFKYPFALNSNWFFKTSQRFVFHPDSARNYIGGELDSSDGIGYSVWKNDTVYNGINARVLRGNYTSPAHAYNTAEFYVQTDTGLVIIGYVDDYGPGFGPYRPVNTRTKSNENNLPVDYLRTILMNDHNELSNVQANCIKYPIVQNSEWFFRNTGAIQTQRKKYFTYEQVQTQAGTYNCIKIQRKLYTGNPEILDTNYIAYDYYSKVGMVKRSYAFKNNPVIYGGQTVGYYDTYTEIVLSSVNIMN